MSPDASFQDLIRRVRARDEQAARELVRRYAPATLVAVRVRLRDPALRRLLDSTDICQGAKWAWKNKVVPQQAGPFT